jgi:hypothetical protein
LSTTAWITFSRRDLRLDRIEKADEVLAPMALHVAPDDSAIEDVKGSEQRGGTVTLVVVRHRPGAARLHRQPRLGTVERLDLAHMGIYGSRCSDQIFIVKFLSLFPFPRSEPVCMTRPVSDAASNSHPSPFFVGRTNIPLASGEGSGGRNHSFLRLFKSSQISVRSPGSAGADQAPED